MQLLNLTIDRIIIHQIFERDSNGAVVPPTQGHTYIRFANSAMSTFKSRVIDALGEDSKAVQMEIVNQTASDLPVLVNKMADQDDNTFAPSSYDFATKLAKAQHRKGIPGGIVVVFSGRYGKHAKRFIGVIKAEVHSGYEREKNEKTNEISLKFVEELLLTPASKLYKTAGFFENNNYGQNNSDLNEKWTVMVSDNQIDASEGKAAAQYFYHDFIGCDYPKTSARTTKHFYEHTCAFIDSLDIPSEEKNNYYNAVFTYLKVNTSSTAGIADFAGQYFDIDTQDEYKEYMTSLGLPTGAFTKDLEHIEKSLKLRKVSFRNKVKIIAPPEVFKEQVTIETIDGEPDEGGNATEWTRVTIKDKIIKQE